MVWLQVWARVLLTVAVVIAAATFADRWLSPDGTPLLLLAIVVLLASLATALYLVWPHHRAPDDLRVARFIEERCAELDDTIATAVDLERGAGRSASQPFAALVTDRAQEAVRHLDLGRIVSAEELRRSALRAGAAAAGLAAACWFAMPLATHVGEVARLRFLPASVAISVEPGNVRLAAGRPLRIAARLQGRAGALTHVAPMLSVDSSGQRRTVAMEPVSDGSYAVTVPRVDRSFAYHVSAGRAVSSSYSVTALVPPHVQRIDLRYEYPSFTGLGSHEERDGGDVFAPAGTRVRLRVVTDKPVRSGHLTMSAGKPALDLAPVDVRTLESTFTLREDGGYRVALSDADGLTSDGTEYFIRLMDDRPAEVHLLRPMGDQQITPLEEVTIEARADDDYGIAAFDLVYAVAGGKEKIVPFTTLGGTNVSRVGSRLLAAEDLGVKPGDVITYYARARDVAHAKPSTLSKSEIFFLEVKPFNEEYSMAQSQAMAAATGTELESLIAAQKDIISATWNLERRSGAGRSASDLKAISEAQSELKARAEQSAGGQRPRRRLSQAPQQVSEQDGPATSPVTQAIASMGRAVQQLDDRHASEAMPHEMAALSALLKAEADVKRRQVTQQANGASSAGNGRQGQDLSSLFDRELKRQQRTNYETRSQIEEQPDSKQGASALDRIRELAKRQEELSRQQRDLANSELSSDDLKRELEKLMREQTELRKQADDLARQMDRRTQQGETGQESQKSVGRAADQMRSAASELGRDDVASAAARGEQAARELRNLEAQMQSATPDARRRALGELQLESQQAADAQRRIANEAQGMDRPGSSADARRRLAGEKEELADRVEALRQSARRLAADPKTATADRPAVSDALKEMDRQQLSDRMRATARQMRQGTGSGEKPGTSTKPLADAERQLADALEAVARRFNSADAGGAKGNTRHLADQLDQARDARDKLARLEKQIKDKEAEATQQAGSRGERAGSPSPDGRQAQRGSQAGGGGGSDLTSLKDEYASSAAADARAPQSSPARDARFRAQHVDARGARVEPVRPRDRGLEAGLRQMGGAEQGRHPGSRAVPERRGGAALPGADRRPPSGRRKRPGS